MKKRICFFLVLSCGILVMAMASVSQSADDVLYEKCKDKPRGPWCYQEAVEILMEPNRCENILKFWPKAVGVHGWCYYQIGLKTKNCKLCDRIKKGDIKSMCKKDVCK